MGVDGKDYAASERAHSSLITPTQMREREVFYGAVRPLLQSFKAAHEGSDVCVADISDTVFTGRAEPLYADDGIFCLRAIKSWQKGSWTSCGFASCCLFEGGRAL